MASKQKRIFYGWHFQQVFLPVRKQVGLVPAAFLAG